MMKYDFDKPVDRTKTSSVKWLKYKDKDIIPMWVADMDFKVSDEIREALRKEIDHGVFGYSMPPEELALVTCDYLKKSHGWDVDPRWIVWLPGVVSGLNVSCRIAGKPGDSILCPVPVYYPFLSAPGLWDRERIDLEMVEKEGRLTFDFDAFKETVTEKTKMLMLCSPHNPGGTVFTKDELEQIIKICTDNNIIICSDEIHCDLILDQGTKHIPTASLKSAENIKSITLMAPSKTYNIPGLSCSFAIIPDRDLKREFLKAMEGIVPFPNMMGYAAAIAAYRDSKEWHTEVIKYLRNNRDYLLTRIDAIPGLRSLSPESTYLAWIDVRELELENPAAFFENAGVGLSDGDAFGKKGFLRLNFGCSKSVLEEALNRIETAVLNHISS